MVRMTIEIPESVQQRLRERGERGGKPVEEVAGTVLARAIMLTSFDELCAETRAKFAATGEDEDDFIDRYLREDHAARGVPHDDD